MNFGFQSLKQKKSSWNSTWSKGERIAVRQEARRRLLGMFFLTRVRDFPKVTFSNALNIQRRKYELRMQELLCSAWGDASMEEGTARNGMETWDQSCQGPSSPSSSESPIVWANKVSYCLCNSGLDFRLLEATEPFLISCWTYVLLKLWMAFFWKFTVTFWERLIIWRKGFLNECI